MEVIGVCDKYRNPNLKDKELWKKAWSYFYFGANGIIDYVDGYTHDRVLLMVAEDDGFFGQYENSVYIGKFCANKYVHPVVLDKAFRGEIV